MPAAQSFIQIIWTFFAILLKFILVNFSSVKMASVSEKQLKPFVTLDLNSKYLTLFIKRKNI